MMRKSAAITILSLIALFSPFFATSVYASASLYLSPSSGTKYVGDKFNVFIYVNSPQATNSYEVRINASGINITGLTTGGTICKLFPTQPSYTSTSAVFQCGLPTPGYTGSNGYIGSVIVQASAPGTARVSIASNSKVLANDGAGTNVLTGFGTATYNIAPRPTSAPSVFSSTHPDQEKWYKNNSPSFTWEGQGSSFSYILDNSPDTTPDQTAEGGGKEKTYSNLTDGVWYFHVIVKGSGGWSAPSHYRAQIDTTPPENFTPEASPSKLAEKPPLISFAATDKTSGIDHYEVRIDGKKWVRSANPYQIPKISSGSHKIEVKAVDKAGNERISSVKVTVKEVPSPSITSPANGSFLPYSDKITIKGTAKPLSSVDIYLDGKKIGSVKSDKNGKFTFVYKELISRGKHSLYATSVTPENIESKPSKTVNFTIDPHALELAGLIIPGAGVYILFGVSVALLLLFVLFFILKNWKSRAHLKEAFENLESQVKTDLSKGGVKKETQAKVEKDIEDTEEEVT